MKTIYLAGGFYGNWKEQVVNQLDKEWLALDPENNDRMSASFVFNDLKLIENVTLVLAHQDSYPNLLGMAAEMGYAAAKGKDIIYVCTNPRINSFLAGLARATFSDIPTAVAFINERY